MCLHTPRHICGEDVCACVCFVYTDSTCALNTFKVPIEECTRTPHAQLHLPAVLTADTHTNLGPVLLLTGTHMVGQVLGQGKVGLGPVPSMPPL